MAEKDIVSKHIIKRLIEDISKYLFELELDSLEVLETQFQRVEERRADIVVRVSESSRQYLLHIEIQNNNDKLMPGRMLRYRTDISMQWLNEDIEQYLIYIGKKPLAMDAGIKDGNLDYKYHLIDMHSIDCENFLKQNNPDALIIAILCDFKGRDESEVIHHIITQLKIYHKDNEKEFRDSISMLEILSDNRDLRKIVTEEEKMLSEVKVENLPSYNIGFERGEAKGEARGEAKGEARGEAKGEARGEAKGEARGEA
ncbi:MAG: hypothetical protein QM500_06800, partial [Methylococcales bacterium]